MLDTDSSFTWKERITSRSHTIYRSPARFLFLVYPLSQLCVNHVVYNRQVIDAPGAGSWLHGHAGNRQCP
jgi:hypothetical protein